MHNVLPPFMSTTDYILEQDEFCFKPQCVSIVFMHHIIETLAFLKGCLVFVSLKFSCTIKDLGLQHLWHKFNSQHQESITKHCT